MKWKKLKLLKLLHKILWALGHDPSHDSWSFATCVMYPKVQANKRPDTHLYLW